MKSLMLPLHYSLLILLASTGWLQAGSVRVLVGFHGEVDAGVFGRLGGKSAVELKQIGVVAGTVPAGQLRALRNLPGIAFVEEDLVRQANFEPNDPYYDTTFSAGNEQAGYNDQKADFGLINAPSAWDVSSGSGMRVAVLDTGIDAGHPDFAGQIATSRNFTGRKRNAISDGDGHGSHTAGTIAAKTNNGIGVAGTAPDAQLVVGKVLGPQGGYDSWVAEGMLWAADPSQGNADIISMSLGGEGSSQVLASAAQSVWNLGVLSIAASGNAGVDGSNHFPSADPNVMAVAAVDEAGGWAGFSNFGATLEVAAPGVNILSTYNRGGYAWASGTSMACPHVAGAAAVIWATDPGQSNASIRQLLAASSTLTVTAPDGGVVPIIDIAGALPSSDPLPTVAISLSPQLDPVSGTVTISAATTSSDGSISGVEFYLEGVSLAVISSPPYSIAWDSTAYDDGPYTISAKVTDSVGVGVDEIEVIVDNEDEAPLVAITSPGEGDTVSGSVTITADASDDRALDRVEFYIDLALVGTATSAPYEHTWNSADGADGPHTVYAVAYDSADQTAVSGSVTFTVNNTASPLTVVSMTPDELATGDSTAVEITGSGFAAGASVTAESGSGPAPSFTVTSVSADGQSIEANLSVPTGGPRRSRTWDVRITNPDGTSVVLAGGLTVLP